MRLISWNGGIMAQLSLEVISMKISDQTILSEPGDKNSNRDYLPVLCLYR